ncbi:MAG: protease HtpX [Chlamydiae bacterium]|nr:protease HtpX [Chlamydiota bacterium]
MLTFRRIFLFLALNFIICITISALLSLLGVSRYLYTHNVSLPTLFLTFFIYGMAGSVISLLLSKKMAKWMMGLRIITPYDVSQEGVLLRRIVKDLSQKASLPKMPEIAIFSSPIPNAFATGPSASNSLVAVSTGLLHQLQEEEIEAVVGHELAHIKNGDMVTMTLLQGVVNTFVLFLSYVLAQAISMNTKRGKDEGGNLAVFYITRMVLEILFMIVGSLIVASFSRYREYRADIGGATLSSKENMIRALKRLEVPSRKIEKTDIPEAVEALMCNGRSSVFELFSTHPPIQKRIKALEESKIPSSL